MTRLTKPFILALFLIYAFNSSFALASEDARQYWSEGNRAVFAGKYSEAHRLFDRALQVLKADVNSENADNNQAGREAHVRTDIILAKAYVYTLEKKPEEAERFLATELNKEKRKVQPDTYHEFRIREKLISTYKANNKPELARKLRLEVTPSCKNCGLKDKVVRIVYGRPMAGRKYEDVYLGGCSPTGDHWYCQRCKHKF